jgi:SAM-dependent methyltransferase
MGFGLFHLGRPERALREAHRVLRSGGSFALSVWAPPARAVGFGILLDAIATHGKSNAPVPSGPPFFRFSDTDECVRCLEETGFATPTVVTVSQTWRLGAPEHLFDVLRRATVRMSAHIGAQPCSAQDAIRAAVTREARRFLGGRGVELPMPAVVASAVRP